jgi:hypothetical protein
MVTYVEGGGLDPILCDAGSGRPQHIPGWLALRRFAAAETFATSAVLRELRELALRPTLA